MAEDALSGSFDSSTPRQAGVKPSSGLCRVELRCHFGLFRVVQGLGFRTTLFCSVSSHVTLHNPEHSPSPAPRPSLRIVQSWASLPPWLTHQITRSITSPPPPPAPPPAGSSRHRSRWPHH